MKENNSFSLSWGLLSRIRPDIREATSFRLTKCADDPTSLMTSEADSRSKATGQQTLRSEAACLEVPIVIPCLNEADTLEVCIAKAQRAFREHGIRGAIIVADNGSTDGSQAIAARVGARVVHVEAKGYGYALMGGIAAARSKFVIMGDADDSYDFLEIPAFLEKLRRGSELVQGCRLPAGGGTVEPGAMPFLHRWWGNPMFSIMTRWMFHWPSRQCRSMVYRRAARGCPSRRYAALGPGTRPQRRHPRLKLLAWAAVPPSSTVGRV